MAPRSALGRPVARSGPGKAGCRHGCKQHTDGTPRPCRRRLPSCSPGRSRCCPPGTLCTDQPHSWQHCVPAHGGVQFEHAEHQRLHPPLLRLAEVLHLHGTFQTKLVPARACTSQQKRDQSLVSGFEAAGQRRRRHVDLASAVTTKVSVREENSNTEQRYNGGGGRCGPGSGPAGDAEPVEGWNGMEVLRRHARRSPSAARRKLPTCPRPRSTNSTTSGTYCHMSRFVTGTCLADSVQGSSRLHVQVAGPCLERICSARVRSRLSPKRLLQPRRLQIQPLHLQRRTTLLVSLGSCVFWPSQASTDVPRRSSIPPARLPHTPPLAC